MLGLGPVFVVLLVAGLAALIATFVPSTLAALRWPVAIVGLLAAGYVIVTMVALVAYGLYQLTRSGPGRRRVVALCQVQARQWTVALLHAVHPGDAGELLGDCTDTAASRPGAGGDGTRRVLLPLSAVSSSSGRHAVRRLPDSQLLSDDPAVLVVGVPGPLEAPDDADLAEWRDLGIWLGCTALLLVVLAWQLAPLERASCLPSGCTRGEPTTIGDMFYWLVTRVTTGGDPNGMGPSSWPNRLIGTMLGFYGLYVLVAIVGRIVGKRIREDATSGAELVDQFNQAQAAAAMGALPEPRRGPVRRAAERLARQLRRFADNGPS